LVLAKDKVIHWHTNMSARTLWFYLDQLTDKACSYVQWDALSTTASGWLPGTVVERRSVTGDLSLSYARPADGGW